MEEKEFEGDKLEGSDMEADIIDTRQIYLLRVRGMPPKDCWITLAGEGKLTPAIQREWLAMAKEYRKVRGNFLVAGFEIEYTLDLILSEFLFPGTEKPASEGQTEVNQINSSEILKDLFDQMFLKGGENLFGRKIAILRNISREVPFLEKLVKKTLIENLQKIMGVRNIFAHYPITFIQRNEKLMPLLIHGEKPIDLDREFFNKYKNLFAIVTSDLENILKYLREEKAQTELEGNPRGWRIFMGHSDLNMDNWLLE